MRRNFYVVQQRLLTGGVLFHLLLAELGVLPDIVGHPANHVGAVEPLDASTREGETIFKGAHPLTELSFRGFKAVLHHRDDSVGEFFLVLLFPFLVLLPASPPLDRKSVV